VKFTATVASMLVLASVTLVSQPSLSQSASGQGPTANGVNRFQGSNDPDHKALPSSGAAAKPQQPPGVVDGTILPNVDDLKKPTQEGTATPTKR
jgi:hypothetical protein